LTVRGRTNISLASSTIIPYIPSNRSDHDLPYELTHKSRFGASIKRAEVVTPSRTRLGPRVAHRPLSARGVGYGIIPPASQRVVVIENQPRLSGNITVRIQEG
jgi:hypothetical protein